MLPFQKVNKVVCVCVCVCVIIVPTNRKNWLTFGGAPVPYTDSASVFHFPHHCGIAVFMRFISISHTVTGRFSRHSSVEMTDADKVRHPDSDQSENSDSNPGSLLVEILVL